VPGKLLTNFITKDLIVNRLTILETLITVMSTKTVHLVKVVMALKMRSLLAMVLAVLDLTTTRLSFLVSFTFLLYRTLLSDR
jgi:hypothetical protein